VTVLNKQGQYAFEVELKANKFEISKAIEKMYSVNVESIRTLRTLGKTYWPMMLNFMVSLFP